MMRMMTFTFCLTNDIPQEQEHQNCQTEINVSHPPAKRKRMTHTETTCEKDEKEKTED